MSNREKQIHKRAKEMFERENTSPLVRFDVEFEEVRPGTPIVAAIPHDVREEYLKRAEDELKQNGAIEDAQRTEGR